MDPCANVNVGLGLVGFFQCLGGIVVVLMYPERSSDHLLPSNAGVGLSIDQVSDFDQLLHADIRPKRYKRVSEKSFQVGCASLRSISLIIAAYTNDSSVSGKYS